MKKPDPPMKASSGAWMFGPDLLLLLDLLLLEPDLGLVRLLLLLRDLPLGLPLPGKMGRFTNKNYYSLLPKTTTSTGFFQLYT
jgi:hypothetical protein